MFFGPAVVGYYNLSQRMLGAPLSVVASAFGDVFKQRASSDFNRFGNCRAIWKSPFRRLSIISLPVFTILCLTAPPLFVFAFGKQWRPSGLYAQLLSPYFMLAFIASPLLRTLYVAERQKYDLLWQIGLFVAVGCVILIGCRANNPALSLGLFSDAYSVMYLIYLWMSYKFSAGQQQLDSYAAAPLGKQPPL